MLEERGVLEERAVLAGCGVGVSVASGVLSQSHHSCSVHIIQS